jgi:hypothetical protein
MIRRSLRLPMMTPTQGAAWPDVEAWTSVIR